MSMATQIERTSRFHFLSDLQPLPDLSNPSYQVLFPLPPHHEFGKVGFGGSAEFGDSGESFRVVRSRRLLPMKDPILDRQIIQAASGPFDEGRGRALAQGQTGAGRIQDADGLVRKLTIRQIPGREPHRRFHSLVENPYSVVLLEGGNHPRIMTWHNSSVGSSTLISWNRRANAGSFSMYFLYSDQVVAATVRSSPLARAGLRRLAASPWPAAPPAPIMVWASSMNRMMGVGRI